MKTLETTVTYYTYTFAVDVIDCYNKQQSIENAFVTTDSVRRQKSAYVSMLMI